MLERAGVVLLLIAATVAIALLVRHRTRRRIAAAEGRVLPAALRPRFTADAGGILYFYGPHCGSCRQQAVILDQLAQREPITVVKVDAAAQADLADALGIATVPATVVVAPGGAVQSINLGLRSLPALAAQLRRIGVARAVA